MGALVTTSFKHHQAEQFVEGFSEPASSNIYVFIARTDAWENNLDSTGTVVTESDNASLEFRLYDRMIAMKRVLSTDIAYVIPRYNWTSGTVYTQYNHTLSNLFNNQFYVIDSSNYNVYKCLFNNSGSASNTKPTGTSTSVISTADGYKWKYMYTIPAAKLSRFLTSDFMYVETEINDVSNAAVDGAINVAIVTNSGTGYNTAPSITITGDGVGATANATLNGNIVSAINMVNVGSGYRYANITISGGGGTNAAARAIISPKGGHGSNARIELGGYYVMINARLENEEGGVFPVDNDFRISGLVKDPQLYGTSTVAGGSAYKLTKNLYLSNVAGTYVLDEYVIGSNSKANAVITSISADAGNSKANIRYFQAENKTANANVFAVGDIVTGAGGAVGTLVSITNQEIQPDSGQIIYVDTFRPIQRAIDQTESLYLVIEF